MDLYGQARGDDGCGVHKWLFLLKRAIKCLLEAAVWQESQPDLREGRKYFVKYTPLQFALRELRMTYTDRAALSIMGAVGMVAGFAGPFSTFEVLNLPLRLIYWLAIAYCTYGAGLLGAIALSHAVLPARKPYGWSIVVQGLGASVPVTLVVVLLNLELLPDQRSPLSDALWLYPYCLAICTALLALMQVVRSTNTTTAEVDPTVSAGPLLIERLPHELRGPILHLSMADHYVEVFTARGKALLLMRLADAIRETDGVPGLQIHRSHWVAKDAVRAIRRVNGKTMVETTAGNLLPISRSYLPSVRATLN
ncbi:LytTR family DNA-binding domain-containing protein [Devosia sp. 1635]|uniref:LytTR family DNA-binding domain-containing protein n=1 Tax=Devosia sp. 1635 TaxID=2726066 RepID=UPI0020BFA957|nr:LytTR family DNA-binding domain-containing protein [Devosia sp. 1635]